MARNVQLRELLLGVEGLALLRHLYDGTDADAAARIAEVRRLLDDAAFAAAEPTTEAAAREGYDAWASSYDEPGNPIIAIEEPAVWALVEASPPGPALDAACGTGRHSRHLAELGHEVTGVDISAGMLERARAAVPGGTFHEADLLDLPAGDASYGLVVCGLALAHVADLDAAIAELGRVLRPGGRLVASVLHPFQALLGWHAPFEDEDDQRRFVREHPHTHADYLDAFTAAGLVLERCVEPLLSATEVTAKRRAYRHVPEAALAAYVGLPGVLVWSATKPG